MKDNEQNLGLNLLSIGNSPVREDTLESLIGDLENVKKNPIIKSPKKGYLDFSLPMQKMEHFCSLSEDDRAHTSYLYAIYLTNQDHRSRNIVQITDLCLNTLPLTKSNYKAKLKDSDDHVINYLDTSIYCCFHSSRKVLLNTHPDPALYYLERGREFFELFNELLLENGKKVLAIQIDNQSKKEAISLIDWKIKYEKEIGRLHKLKGEFGKSSKHLESVIKYGEKINNVFAAKEGKLELANNLILLGDKNNAKDLLDKILIDETEDSNALGTAYRLLAALEINNLEHEYALELLEQARERLIQSGDKPALALTDADSLICAYNLLPEKKSLAEEMAEKCLSYLEEDLNLFEIYIKSYLLSHLGNYEFRMKNHRKALDYYEKAVDYAKQSGMPGYELMARGLWIYAHIYNILEDRVSNDERDDVKKTITDTVDGVCTKLAERTEEKDVLRFHLTNRLLKEGIITEDWSSFDKALNDRLREDVNERDKVYTYKRAGDVEKYRNEYDRAAGHYAEAENWAKKIKQGKIRNDSLELIKRSMIELDSVRSG